MSYDEPILSDDECSAEPSEWDRWSQDFDCRDSPPREPAETASEAGKVGGIADVGGYVDDAPGETEDLCCSREGGFVQFATLALVALGIVVSTRHG